MLGSPSDSCPAPCSGKASLCGRKKTIKPTSQPHPLSAEFNLDAAHAGELHNPSPGKTTWLKKKLLTEGLGVHAGSGEQLDPHGTYQPGSGRKEVCTCGLVVPLHTTPCLKNRYRAGWLLAQKEDQQTVRTGWQGSKLALIQTQRPSKSQRWKRVTTSRQVVHHQKHAPVGFKRCLWKLCSSLIWRTAAVISLDSQRLPWIVTKARQDHSSGFHCLSGFGSHGGSRLSRPAVLPISISSSSSWASYGAPSPCPLSVVQQEGVGLDTPTETSRR